MSSTATKVWITKQDINIFSSAKDYYQQLLSLIANAKHRIYITALYLQDDEAGRTVLSALYQAKQQTPTLDIKIFVDGHRAQRGLIGEAEQLGNRAMYLEFANRYKQHIPIYGISVKKKELFGVLHLKGMVFDDMVFYSGASLNNIYLHHQEQYRLDRYYQIQSSSLADSFCQFAMDIFAGSGNCYQLNQTIIPNVKTQNRQTKKLRTSLKRACYQLNEQASQHSGDKVISVEPLLGCGVRQNQLNSKIRQLVKNAEQELVIFTPYFNLPKVLTRDLVRALRRGVKVQIIVGDKKANDFFIPEHKPFSTIGIIPYVYERLLYKFVRRWQRFIDNDLLIIRLWRHDNNSFHLKGVIADWRYHLLTGSNLNPRAWSLDLENGLLLDDAQQLLMAEVKQELDNICQHTKEIKGISQLEKLADYPDKPRRLIKRIRLAQVDRLLKRFL